MYALRKITPKDTFYFLFNLLEKTNILMLEHCSMMYVFAVTK